MGVLFLPGCGDGSDPALIGGDRDTRARDTLAIVPSEIFLTEGESVSLEATLSGPSAVVFDPGQVAWSIDDGAVATIDASGVITALKRGEVQVKAAYGVLVATARAAVRGIPRSVEAAAGQEEWIGTVGRPLDGEISVRVLDKDDLPLPDIEVHFEILSGGGELGAESSLSGSDGYARTSWTLGPALGRQEVQAGVGDLPKVTLAAEALPDYLTATVVKSQGDGQEAEVATLLPEPLRIQVVDSFGHPLPGVPIRWTFLAGGGSSVGPAAEPPWDQTLSTTTGEDGRDVVYWQLGTRAGLQEAIAGVDTTSTGSQGVSDPSTAPKKYNPASERFQATGKPGKPKSVVVSPATSSILPGATEVLSATVLDRFDNTIQGTDPSWSTDNPAVLSVDQTGTVQGLQSGTGTVTASVENVDGSAVVMVEESPGTSGPLPVVPGLRGFGVTTPAGRGGAIIRVTNLDDAGPGSLRAALASPGPRTIIFDVGGTIVLSTDLRISDPYVTVAGQTAPSPGITLRGAGLKISSHDVLVQHIRFRVGDDPSGPDPENRDAFQILGPDAHDVVMDHISASWAIDEVASTWYPLVDVTISHSIIAEGLRHSLHPEGPHSCGLLIGDGSRRVAVIGNLLAHNYDRNPILKGNTSTVVANNLIYDPGYRSIRISDPDGSGPSLASVVGNVLLTGSSTENDYLVSIGSDSKSGTRVHVSDNVAPTVVRVSDGLGFDPLVGTPPIWVPEFSARPASQVTDWVLGGAGARPGDRDAVDLRLVDEVRTGGGRVIDSQADVGGWPMDAPVYRARELPADPWGDQDGDGYTNLEEWLHELAQQVEGS